MVGHSRLHPCIRRAPIVIAMAAKQNVLGAVSGGWMAILAGVAAVAASFAMIPLLSRFGDTEDSAPGERD